MGNAAGSMEVPQGKEGKAASAPPGSTGSQKKTVAPKLPMPPEEELEQRFGAVLNTMNLPPDKVKILSQYDNEKKWDLICDQERFQVKNPPSAYLEKLKSHLDHGGVSRKFKRRVQESTQILRELEISLRTNYIGWAQEFLNEENQGLDVLVDYLSFAHGAVTHDVDTLDNGTLPTDKNKTVDKSVEDLSRSASNSPTHSASKASKAFTVRYARPAWADGSEGVTRGRGVDVPAENNFIELNMATFEEQFKTKAQSAPVELGTLKMKLAHKTPSKVSLMEPNRAKNLAITLRKEGMAASDICCAIETYNQRALSLDFLELLERFIPTEYEMKLIHSYECEGRPLDELSEEDRFMVLFSKIPRLSQRISTLTFMGNFPESVQLIQPQLNAIIAASMSIKSSNKLKKILEIILAFGNYMNSSKRGAAYGFRLQSLDMLLDTKSTDRRQTLLHFIESIIQDKYPEVQSFYTELHFLDKAALVSIDSILQDVRALERGMEGTRREFSVEKDNPVLQTFLSCNTELLRSLIADGKTAQDVYDSAVEYFGENSKTTPPSMFFPVFVRFIKAYKQAEQENKQRKKQHVPNCEAPTTPPKPEITANKVCVTSKLPQMDLIAELKKRQVSPLVREGKDGAIEDIITALKSVPFTARSAKRSSRLFCDSVFSDEVTS
ncbi:formin-like protein 1 [Plectropomus leopardus]|uniref:formin-like protein 1 n=1 Tax=Plectropomus leopardus TaxID=160734 RepID=UPI001C4BA202|nr:formin-like protein 1 [Plectropomus leopardus]